MSVKSIQFNSFSLQSTNWKTKDIIYRNLPEKNVDINLKSRRDGFDVVNTYYSQKVITIEGTVISDTEANLKILVDNMKESLSTDEANLDINDGGTTLRYVCSVQNIAIPEEHYNITHLPYKISFICQPFAMLTSTTTDTNSIANTSPSPFTDTINPIGSAKPKPTLKWTCSGAPSAAITQISFTNSTTGDTITVGSLALDANGDYLEIDCDAMTVKVSHDGGAATDIDYTGVFPDFSANSNNYSITITGGGATWNLAQIITYYPSYL